MQGIRFMPGRVAAIYIGGVLGALARVGLAEAVPHGPGEWPWATLAVNLAGALRSATSRPGCTTAARRAGRTRS